jgi:hypothetical protein
VTAKARRLDGSGTLAAAAALLIALAGCSGTGDDLPPPAAPDTEPTATIDPVHQEILEVYAGSVAAMVAAQRAGDPDYPDLTQFFLEQTPAHTKVLNGITIQEANGEYYEGDIEVVSSEVTELDPEATPPEATIRACLDRSGYRLVNREDNSPVPDAVHVEHYLVTATAWSDPDGRWFIAETEEHWDQTC